MVFVHLRIYHIFSDKKRPGGKLISENKNAGTY
jgi:hypothetical protein